MHTYRHGCEWAMYNVHCVHATCILCKEKNFNAYHTYVYTYINTYV